jgi:hypothetical protein
MSSTVKLTRISKLGTALAVSSVFLLIIIANVVPSSQIHVALMMEGKCSSKCRFLPQPHGVAYQKTAFFTATAVKTSNLYIALTGWAL